MPIDISALPDYPALKQIQEALWGHGETRGAAVMVGAGFSQNARLASNIGRRPPLWHHFEREMAGRLYPGSQAAHDPLKLAEEYKAALGQHALDGLIRKLVPDDQWTPGDLHERLLSLPWADVLTTNWDTLLERTELPNPDRTYEVVRTIADIARTRAPRIVKLHGSLPSHTPFIFTEEDFRRYPQRFAPFVNLAQQVLLENELCLFGFSGDDPTRAVTRGLKLHEAGVLTSAEASRLAEAVWSRREGEDGLPADLDLYPFVLLILPEPVTVDTAAVFDRCVVQPALRGQLSDVGLSGVQWAGSHPETSRYVLSDTDAVAIFDAAMAWRPIRDDDDDGLDLASRGDQDMDQAIGDCLSWGVLPRLSVGALDAERCGLWISRIESGQAPALLQTAHQLARLHPPATPRAVAAVRRGLASRNDNTAVFAVWAIHRFLLAQKAGNAEVPAVLRSDIATMCAFRRDGVLSQALWCARQLLLAGLFDGAERRQVIEGLAFLLTELRYDNWDEADPRTKSLSLHRAQCVLLAEALLAYGEEDPAVHAWIAEREADPFPEVRFASPQTD